MISQGRVKICSLRETAHARFVLDAGADLFGLIFAPARRKVTARRAREIVDAVRALAVGAPPLAVGVFVDAPADEINAIVRSVGLDLVQLHGSELPESLSGLDVPAIKSLRPDPATSISDVHRQLERYAIAERPPIAFLLDGFHPSHAGGEGVRADWALAAELATSWPIVLAGGLSPENVEDAIDAVRPIAVDVSSGVETDGMKDAVKIATFVKKARAAFAGDRASILDG